MRTFDGWERWYAWHPVKVDGRWAWRRYVDRTFCAALGMDFWTYRESFPEEHMPGRISYLESALAAASEELNRAQQELEWAKKLIQNQADSLERLTAK
jgi:hypothetical protein